MAASSHLDGGSILRVGGVVGAVAAAKAAQWGPWREWWRHSGGSAGSGGVGEHLGSRFHYLRMEKVAIREIYGEGRDEVGARMEANFRQRGTRR